MTRKTIPVGTVDEIGGETVGTANVWEREGYDGLTVQIFFDERTLVVAVGDTFQAGGLSHRLIAIEPDASTDGADLVIESEEQERAAPPVVSKAPGDPGTPQLPVSGLEKPSPAQSLPSKPKSPPMSPEASQAWRRQPETLLDIDPISPLRLAEVLRESSGTVLRALGSLDASELTWTVTSRESYVDAGRGEKLGPDTRTVSRAEMPEGSSAEVLRETDRWNAYEISRVTVSGRWVVGDRCASLFCSAQSDARIGSVSIEAKSAVQNAILRGLGVRI